MKFSLVFTGKTSESYLREGVKVYLDRIRHYLPVEVKEITPLRETRGLDPAMIRAKESEWFLKNLPSSGYLVLLDEAGSELTSMELSAFLQARMNQGIRHMIFLTGGAYGVTEEIKKKSNFILSLSKMTFTHQMSRLIIVEQLYRALTILKGEPYHNP
ncbi:MAG: 23S rRNA (pseudouridine(1915)-N(3))-methyltransferase RlmH [Bacteroidetes bacterium]|nr:23S rRNA (pseudouridine(1915)-N(3))-methyltransferase RlmH [Bacteroidota bacterium]